ncbi:MAG: glutathione S-transferase family protein [Pseudomonadota bacterium]
MPANELILHHYPASLFSEKIRALLGYLELSWRSAEISPIMPRPELMPLTGGYRRTPVLQIGADIYCDTEIIARRLAAVAGNDALYAPGFLAERTARWADGDLFRTTVAVNFRSEALEAQMGALNEGAAEAFFADRAQLIGDRPLTQSDPANAIARLNEDLATLERSLAGDFLFGATPSIADFSVYHCLWFVAGNPANADLLAPWPAVRAFMGRMAAFGHGSAEAIALDAALAIGTQAEPAAVEAGVDEAVPTSLGAGAAVKVIPTETPHLPVEGTLAAWGNSQITIAREDPVAGRVNVHFPLHGYDVIAA